MLGRSHSFPLISFSEGMTDSACGGHSKFTSFLVMMNTPARESSETSPEAVSATSPLDAGESSERSPVSIFHEDGDDTDSRELPLHQPAIALEGDKDEPVALLGLRASDRFLILGLSAVIFVLSVVHLLRLSWQGTPAFEIEQLPSRQIIFQIDMNHANWVEWMQLPEIGEAMARRIVADREERGPFRSVDDVRRVRGIGPLTMEKIRPYLIRDRGDAEVRHPGD